MILSVVPVCLCLDLMTDCYERLIAVHASGFVLVQSRICSLYLQPAVVAWLWYVPSGAVFLPTVLLM